MELRDAVQRIALEWPSYGRPRITEELRRQGWTVNPKRVRRLLREDNLLCLRNRKFVVTTDSNHGRKIYPNLVGKITPTGMDQLWVADITYIRLQEEFIFLAVILDAYSRRVIGWALDRTMEDDLTLAALRMALDCRNVQPGLVHHSDHRRQAGQGIPLKECSCGHFSRRRQSVAMKIVKMPSGNPMSLRPSRRKPRTTAQKGNSDGTGGEQPPTGNLRYRCER